MRAFMTINSIGCFSPAVAMFLLSMLVPLLVWADPASDKLDDDNKNSVDYTAVELQNQNTSRVSEFSNAQLEAMAADINSRESGSSQRLANYLWLREATSEKKPVTGGKAAGKLMRAVTKHAWKQWRASKVHTSKWLPDEKGGYSLSPSRSETDYSMQLDGKGLNVSIETSTRVNYLIKLQNDGASIGVEHRF
jgi:hypothetical protein